MNIKFNIEYKGTNFHGWQIQNNAQTIQGELKKAFKVLLPTHSINIIASGRTDSGVHAYNQVASVKLPENLDLQTFFNSVNGIIDNDWIQKYIDKSDLDVRYINKFLGILALEVWYKLFVSNELSSKDTLD